MKLDVNVLKNETLDLAINDDLTLCIKKPSKGLLVEIHKADVDMNNTTKFEEIVDKLETIVCKILSNNTAKQVVTTTDLEEWEIDYNTQLNLYKAYMQFVNTISANPN